MCNKYAGLTLVALGLLAACDTGTEPVDDPAYFPLAVGNTWTYAPEDPFFGEPFEWRVTDRRGDTVSVARPAGASHSGQVTLLDRGADIYVLVDGEDFAPFYHFEAGKTWVHRDTWECDDGADVIATVEESPIITPAGVFPSSLRVERRTPAPCTDAGTIVEWWAPAVGLVQWEELNFYAGGPLTFHLIRFTTG